MQTHSVDDLLDRLVAEYADRAARGGEPQAADLLERAPAEHRAALERCFRMIRAGGAHAPGLRAALGPGARLAGYRIVRELGRGGMAVVYLATQTDLDRPVALKVLRPGLALERRHVDRFRREALSIARLKHPHIVQVFAVGEDDGYHWLAMEYVDGPTLADVYERLARDGRAGAVRASARDLAAATGLALPEGREASFEQALCLLLAPVARALGVAHELGIVHRDIKPSNILIHRDGRAVVGDFGLAKGDGDPGLSLTGEPLGTPFYMSPEQAALSEFHVDQRTDVYSLGVTLYEGLTGRRPFDGPTVLAVLEAVRRAQPPSPRAIAQCSRDAEAVVRRAMAKAPAERYPTALELAVELGAIADGHTTQALVREGSGLRRGWRVLRGLARGEILEYESDARLLGLPLVHVVRPTPGGKRRPARGWLAIGNQAVGVVAIGNFAVGVLGIGGFALGLVSLGGFALGGLALGGFSAGYLAAGGCAVGYGAVGGVAYGFYAMGGRAHGVHVIDALVRDPAAIAWFRPWLPWFQWLPGFDRLAQFFD